MMFSVDGCIKSVKIYKNLEKSYNKKTNADSLKKTANFSCHKQPTFLVIQLFQMFIYFYTFYSSIYT